MNSIGIRSISFKRLLSLKPNFSKFKLTAQPPGHIVGTVNDAYVPPESNYYEGGHHWTYEKIVTGSLIPLTIAPFIFGTEIPVVDAAFCVSCLFHSHMGLKSCIIDYIPKRVYGIWHTYASRLLTLGTSVGLYGVYLLETEANGLFNIISGMWSA